MADNKVLFKFGTAAQYAALETKNSNALYFLLDTNEIYRGDVPFSQPHIFTGIRENGANDADTITAIVSNNTPVTGDFLTIHNADNSTDAFIYSKANDEWVHIGNTTTLSLTEQITDLDDRITDIETLLNGTIETTGLVDRVENLETTLANLNGAFHFKGSVADINSVIDPSEGDVYQVDDNIFAWNGTEWVELNGIFDLSNYVTTSTFNTALNDINDQVADLEALIGQPANSTTDPVTGDLVEVPATGIYSDLANHADTIIPLFNGVIAGLVPVDNASLTNNVKATRFLNALGNWVTVSTSGGQTTYTDPEGHVYNTVEDYVIYMLQNHVEAVEYAWESIDV